ncbi:hypothetical protein [Flavihumibacter profundi]|uniref:hypothetical protein n=1 Tax=Flavihumibacter profundi TaxID=2716883 RepID=UPI001CC60F2A|nr:hypothetical protein [Flavihumibacter profundi]MBZ5858105.1 hypothetical protein [Flavihumibacter profundi]
MKQMYPRPTAIALAKVFQTLFMLTSLLCVMSVSAQSLNFSKYELVNGGEGQKGAEYRFTGVINDTKGNPLADCIVRIDGISPGVQLKNIDNPNSADDAAFQPVVEHMNTIGPSWIEFSFSFIPHVAGKNDNDMFQLPLLAASIYGLNGFDKAQEFVECDLGRNSQVIYETEINNLMVTRIGNSYRAENKWGVQTGKMASASIFEKFSLLNQQVTGFKVKFGVNRKAQTWAGVSTYNLALSNSAPDLTASYKPSVISFDAKAQQNYVSVEWNTARPEAVKDVIIEKSADGAQFSAIDNIDMKAVKNINGHFSYADQAATGNTRQIYYRLHMVKENGGEEYSAIRKVILADCASQVDLKLSSSLITDKLMLTIPQNWNNKEVVFEIFNENAGLVKKVIEHKAPANVELELNDLPAGTYVIRSSCQKEFAVQYAIHANRM